jgi:hypothetical protein
LMWAANMDHHEIVGRLLAARADLNTKNGRMTALHYAAYGGSTKSAVALLVGGADHTITNNSG